MMGSITVGARLDGPARWGRRRTARLLLIAAIHLSATIGVVVGTSAAPAAAAVPVPPFVQVDNGSTTSCALTADGQAYCWGSDNFGAVGNGPGTDTQFEPVPVDAPAGVEWSSLSVGGAHTCAVTTTGAAFCWGGDFGGQLGNGPGSTADQHAPGPVVTPPGVTWTAISAGLNETCATTTLDQLYCWGDMGDDYEGSTPNLVPGGPWANAEVGNGTTCAVTTLGAGYCWGTDVDGRLGNGPAVSAFQRAPSPVATPPGVRWTRITPGHATCGLTTSSTIFCWGPDTRGSLGNGAAITANQPSPSPVNAPAGVLWAEVAVLNDQAAAACALSDAGAIYCWGSDSLEQQANGPGVMDQASPGPIVSPSGVVWARLTGGGHNVCAAAVGDPTTYCWGSDYYGGIGDGLPSATADTPTPVGAGQTIDFAPIADVVVGSSPFTVVATASSGQPVTYEAMGPCSIDGSTVTPTDVGTCTIAAFQAGGGGWGAASTARSFTIHPLRSTQAITFPHPGNRTFGGDPFSLTATASSGLPVSLTVPSGAPCTIAGSTVTIIGAGDCAITASQPGDDFYLPAAPRTHTVVIGKAFQAIITYSPGVHRFGDDPFQVRAEATSGLPVTFSVPDGAPCTVSGDLVTITGIGDCVITASQPGNENFHAAESRTVTAELKRTRQTIEFPSMMSVIYGTPPIELTATATSGLPVSYDTSGDCSVTGSTLTITGAGSCAVTASQAGNDTVEPADPVTNHFSIGRASQEITFEHPGPKSFGDAPFELVASASSGLPITFTPSSGNACEVSGSTVTITGVGNCIIAMTQFGNDDYTAALLVSVVVPIGKGAQVITFPALDPVAVGAEPFVLAATSSSGLPVSYRVADDSPCFIDHQTVHVRAAGPCEIIAEQFGNGTYAAADPVVQVLQVTKGPQVISVIVPGEKIYGFPPFTLSASSTSGLPVVFSVPADGPCTLEGATVTIVAAGDCVIAANQLGNESYDPAPPVIFTVPIVKANQFITLEHPGSRTFGDPPFAVSATASSGLPVTFTVFTGPCTITGSTVTITGAGICGIEASQAGDGNYNAAATSSTAVVVFPGEQTISFTAPDTTTYGAAPFGVIATADSGLAVTFTTPAGGPCAVSGATVTVLATGACEITASQAGGDNYLAADPVTRTVAVQPAPLTIAASDATMTYGGASPTVTPSFSGFVNGDGLSVITTAPACGGGTPTTAAGVHAHGTSCSGAEAANYAISYVPGSLTVTKATLTVTADPSAMVHRRQVPSLTATITGFVNEETAAVLSGSPALSTTASSTSSVGTYPITVTQGDLTAENYSFTFVPGTLTVAPAPTVLAVDPVILRISPLGVTLGKVTARLALADPALPLAGHTITFTSGTTALCTATTAADGTATCQLPLVTVLTTILGGGYQATFAGTPDLVASSAKGALLS